MSRAKDIPIKDWVRLAVEVAAITEFESHTLFVGKIIGAENLGEQEPMTYSYYHLVKGGLTQKNAPTFNPG